MRVTADATVEVEPDQAVLDVAVVTESEDADRAARKNAEKVAAVLAALREALGGGASSRLRTSGYSLTPKYTAHQPGQPSRIAGYRASNVVQIVSDDLEGVGKLVDRALAAGANRVTSLSFVRKDEQPVREQALREATIRARGRAEAIASALGLEVRRVLSVEQGGSGVAPLRREARLMQANSGVPTEVVPGTLELRESVTLTAELSQR